MTKEELISEIKDSISRVNLTLGNYEDFYISASRTGSVINKEPCNSFSDFLEIRFNRECFNIPELKEALDLTKGHLFICKELINPDVYSRRFDSALITLISDDDIDKEVDKILINECTDLNYFKSLYPEVVSELKANIKNGIELAKVALAPIGKTSFRFNSVKRKIRLTDENNKIIK